MNKSKNEQKINTLEPKKGLDAWPLYPSEHPPHPKSSFSLPPRCTLHIRGAWFPPCAPCQSLGRAAPSLRYQLLPSKAHHSRVSHPELALRLGPPLPAPRWAVPRGCFGSAPGAEPSGSTQGGHSPSPAKPWTGGAESTQPNTVRVRRDTGNVCGEC